jgi:predicted glycoside hydrolase/deacetylase ChbG (UPF0249 family)
MLAIINADDLGASEEINDAIFTRMAQGCVTSASLMANGPSLSSALRQLPHFPRCSFGAHLTADEFAPLSDRRPLRCLLDEEGNFVPGRIRKVATHHALRRALTEEFSQQIEKLLAMGVNISHIDSHHHVHTLPWLFPVLKQLQYRYGIRKVRIAMNIYPPDRQMDLREYYSKALFNFLLRNVYQTTTVGGFTNLETFTKRLRCNYDALDSVELMVHPGRSVDVCEAALLETIALEGLPWAGRLINYAQL